MEQLVEQYASKLMSKAPGSLYEAIRWFEELKAEGAQSTAERSKYPRLLQELLAYNGGALVKSILRKVVDVSALITNNPFRELTIDDLDAVLKLVYFTDSPVVARFCLREVEDARLLATAIMSAHGAFMMSSEGDVRLVDSPISTNVIFALFALRGIVNLARISRAFCQLLRELDDLFPALEQLLDVFERTESLPFALLSRAADDTLRLVMTLALSEDCRDWAIDRGVIKIHASFMRLTVKGDLVEQRVKDWPEVRNFTKGMEPAQIRGVFADLTQELLEIDRQIHDPRTEEKTAKKLRAIFFNQVKQQITRLGYSSETRSAKSMVARATSCFETPIVCSWDLGDAGAALEGGKPFSKCASCSLALYCR